MTRERMPEHDNGKETSGMPADLSAALGETDAERAARRSGEPKPVRGLWEQIVEARRAAGLPDDESPPTTNGSARRPGGPLREPVVDDEDVLPFSLRPSRRGAPPPPEPIGPTVSAPPTEAEVWTSPFAPAEPESPEKVNLKWSPRVAWMVAKDVALNIGQNYTLPKNKTELASLLAGVGVNLAILTVMPPGIDRVARTAISLGLTAGAQTLSSGIHFRRERQIIQNYHGDEMEQRLEALRKDHSSGEARLKRALGRFAAGGVGANIGFHAFGEQIAQSIQHVTENMSHNTLTPATYPIDPETGVRIDSTPVPAATAVGAASKASETPTAVPTRNPLPPVRVVEPGSSRPSLDTQPAVSVAAPPVASEIADLHKITNGSEISQPDFIKYLENHKRIQEAVSGSVGRHENLLDGIADENERLAAQHRLEDAANRIYAQELGGAMNQNVNFEVALDRAKEAYDKFANSISEVNPNVPLEIHSDLIAEITREVPLDSIKEVPIPSHSSVGHLMEANGYHVGWTPADPNYEDTVNAFRVQAILNYQYLETYHNQLADSGFLGEHPDPFPSIFQIDADAERALNGDQEAFKRLVEAPHWAREGDSWKMPTPEEVKKVVEAIRRLRGRS